MYWKTWINPAYDNENLRALCNQITRAHEKSIAIYKSDSTSSVFEVPLTEKETVIVKHHRLRSFGRRLRRLFQPSRAKKNRDYSQKLKHIGIPSFEVLATIEQRWGPFTSESFVIMENLKGISGLELFGYDCKPVPCWESAAKQITSLIQKLEKNGLRHRDLNFSNLIWKDEKIYLIDLDGMRKKHCWQHKTDRKRFLENWTKEKAYAAPAAKGLFDKLLNQYD